MTAETTKYTLELSEAKLDVKPWKEMMKGIPEEMECILFPLYRPMDWGKTSGLIVSRAGKSSRR